jgi:chromosome condensin MukBEF ATPase and DNA-binding subunit MukB
MISDLSDRIRNRTETLRQVNEEMREEIKRLEQSVANNRNILNGIINDYEISEELLSKLKKISNNSIYKGAER